MGHRIPKQLFKEQQGWWQSWTTSPLGWELPDSLSGGAHPATLRGPSQKPLSICKELKRTRGEKKKKEYKGKTATIIFGLSTRCCTLQSIVSCLTFSGVERTSCTNSFHLTVISWLAPSGAPRSVRGVWLCHT